jgi:MOSC domain-containing protein YiiM
MGGSHGMARILSVNISLPKEIDFEGQRITTGIFKEPVEGPVTSRTLNLDGDRHADLTVHGGPDRAVYSYSIEHYDFWHGVFPEIALQNGMFGENLTVDGLIESEVNVGDVFRIGSATVNATQPRMPCYKLGVKFGRMDVLKKFLASGRSGIYFRVLEEGEVAAGDTIVKIKEDSIRITIGDIVRLYSFERGISKLCDVQQKLTHYLRGGSAIFWKKSKDWKNDSSVSRD